MQDIWAIGTTEAMYVSKEHKKCLLIGGGWSGRFRRAALSFFLQTLKNRNDKGKKEKLPGEGRVNELLTNNLTHRRKSDFIISI